jgi:hypothetical protein
LDQGRSWAEIRGGWALRQLRESPTCGQFSFDYATGGHGWTFDTSPPGDSNIGHASGPYGTNLTEDQKAALMVLEDQVTLGRQIPPSSLDFRILRRETRR